MLESIITISITALLAGFIFSMPVAGPISIIVASNALRGRLRFCNFVSLGASIADFTYMFIAVFGLTKLFSFYEPFIPYIFSVGCMLFIYLGYKIFITKIDIEHIDGKSRITEKIEKREKGGFYTGFMVNALNPTLFVGAVTLSFFLISFVSSIGLHTGGLAMSMDQRKNEIVSITGKNAIDNQSQISGRFEEFKNQRSKTHPPDKTNYSSSFHLVISICFAFFLALGNIIWLSLMAFLIVRYRQSLNIKIISGIIKSMGVLLWIVALYFGFLSVKIFLSL